MNSPLSPAAQAVFFAWSEVVGWGGDPPPVERLALAAALRAAADQVVPEQALEDMPGRFVNGCCHNQRQDTRRELLAIADELEADL